MFKPDDIQVRAHIEWLESFAPQHLRNWEKLLGGDPEPAMCEACARSVLQANGCSVEPSEDLTGASQRPDFLCRRKEGSFYVEVTCIGIGKATEVTHLRHIELAAGDYGFLNGPIYFACRNKTAQCAGLDAPCLVAVGTHHRNASALCIRESAVEQLLTGRQAISVDIDTRTGSPVGKPYNSTTLDSATFLRPDSVEVLLHARNPVSGMLICGFGSDPFQVYGTLHPSPVRPFDRGLLPRIKFCRLKDGYQNGMLATEWV